jgi:hypothetical protein
MVEELDKIHVIAIFIMLKPSCTQWDGFFI